MLWMCIDVLGIIHANQASMLLPLKCLSLPVIFSSPFQGCTSLWILFVICDSFLSIILCCLFLATLLSSDRKGLTLWLSRLCCFLVFCHFPIWRPGLGVVLDYEIPFSLNPLKTNGIFHKATCNFVLDINIIQEK